MNRSIRTRVQAGLFAAVAAFALLAVLSVLAIDRLGGAISTILRDNYESVVACEDMKEGIERLDSAAQFASNGRDDIGVPMITTYRSHFEQALTREEANITLAGEGEEVRQISARYRAYRDKVDAVLGSPAGERKNRYYTDLLPAFGEVKDHIQRVLEMNQAAMLEADREARALARRTVRQALPVAGIAFALILYLAFWLPRAVVRPIERLRLAAQAIGEGRLDVEVPEAEVAELASLSTTFRSMLAKLRAYRDSSLGELLAAKDVARATLECMLDPVVVFAAGGEVRYANDAAERAFGVRALSADEPRSDAELPDAVLAARDAVLERREQVLPRTLSEAVRWQTSDGEKDYLVRALELLPAPGEPPSAIVLAQDVTRYRRIDELKSDMLATVSHQFKTPLTSLRMATHLLLETATGPLNEAQLELVTTTRDETERLRTMVEELLDVVRIEREAGQLRPTPVDPFLLASEVAEAHRPIAKGASVALEVDPSSDRGPVLVDRERAAIAIANLVSNAIRHSRIGGVVKLSASRHDGQLYLAVTDQGEGISPERLRRLKEGAPSGVAGGRTGIGLTIAREVATQHGGELDVASEIGKGSTFTLRFGEPSSYR